MSWGAGVGEPWGGAPLTTVEDPRSDVGEDPISYIFTDEADGPLPGVHWEPYILSLDAGGDITAAPEPSQDTYFKVQSGFGLWNYTRSPISGLPATEQGHAIALGSVLVGRNARASLLFREPVRLLDVNADEFMLRMGLFLRFSPTASPSVSGIEVVVQAHWSAGVWVTPLSLEVYNKVPGAAPALVTSVTPTEPPPLDTWQATPDGVGELEVFLREGDLAVELAGAVSLDATVPAEGADNRVAILGQAWNRTGATVTPVPAVVGVQLQSLRDMERLGPSPELFGSEHMEAVQHESTYFLPLLEWLDAGRLKRVGGRQFEAKEDFVVEDGWVRIKVQAGDIIRAVEPYAGQEFTKCVRDLAAHRGRGGI